MDHLRPRRRLAPLLPLLAVLFPASPAAPTEVLVVSDTDTGALYELSLDDAMPTLIGSYGPVGYLAGLAWDPSGSTLFGTTTYTDNLCRVSPYTGEATIVGALGAELIHAVAFHPAEGKLYGAHGPDDELFEIDPATGAATRIGPFGLSLPSPQDAVSGLAFHPDTHVLYGCVAGPSRVGLLVVIDPATGTATEIAPTQPLTALAFHRDARILYGMDNGPGSEDEGLYTIDLQTGEAQLVGRPGLGNCLGLEFVSFATVGVEASSWGSAKSLFRTTRDK